MTLPQLHARLTALGVVLSIRDDRLVIDAPAGLINDEIRAELQTNKVALLELLKAPPPQPGSPAASREAARRLRVECPKCGSNDLLVMTHFRRCNQCKASWTVWDAPPPQPGPRPDRDAEARRGDELRAAGLALPLCWLPDPPDPQPEPDDPDIPF
jgi:hypothetical protein